MSTKEMVYSMLDNLTETQLTAVAELLKVFTTPKYKEVDPDEIDLQMIAEAEADDSTGEPIEDFANRLGIDL